MTLGNGNSAPRPAVEELVFLARSHHRVALLEELTSSEQSRATLTEATGISQPTLSRILGDFEQRRWVRNHHNGAYSLTPLGDTLAGAVGDVLDVLETIDELATLEADLPWDDLEFDLRALSTATVTTPTPTAPLAHMRRFDELASSASAVAVCSNVLACAPSSDAGATDRGFLESVDEVVVTKNALEADVDDTALVDWLGERVAEGDLSLYVLDASLTLLFGLFDETAGLVPIDEAGLPTGLIESQNEEVRSWLEATFATYRDRGRLADQAMLAAVSDGAV